jgi:hypothetical protein
MQISTVNSPSISLKGPVKVPQKEQCGPTPHTPMLEHVFANDSRVPSSHETRSLRRRGGAPDQASSTQATGQAKATRGEASVQCTPVMALAAQLAEALHHDQQPAIPARYSQGPEVDTPMAATKRERPMEATPGPGP